MIKEQGNKKIHILVTNDDGIHAPGLLALAQAMSQFGKVSVLAPERNWSATGHVRTLDRPLRARQVELADGSFGWSTDGAPSDCVALGIQGFFKESIDLVVSGINPYANVGHDLTYSGTVTAAMEALIGGVPSIAFSLDTPDNTLGEIDFETAASFARLITETALRKGLDAKTLLNVNIPSLPFARVKGIHITRQGQRVYHDKLEQRLDPRGVPYYWNIGGFPTGIAEDGTDIGALAEKFVSVTPVQLDLTDYQKMKELQAWSWGHEEHEEPIEISPLFLQGIYY